MTSPEVKLLGGLFMTYQPYVDFFKARLAEILPIPPDDKQSCLELDDPIQRLDYLSPRA